MIANFSFLWAEMEIIPFIHLDGARGTLWIKFIKEYSLPLQVFALGGTKGKNSKKQWIVLAGILIFSFGPPPWNNENKSCLNELKFLEASKNHKSSICWQFQLSISCGTHKSAKIPLPVAKMIWSFQSLCMD